MSTLQGISLRIRDENEIDARKNSDYMPPSNTRKINQQTELPFSSSLSWFSCFVSHVECLKLKYKSYKEFSLAMGQRYKSQPSRSCTSMVSTTKFGTISRPRSHI